MAEKTTLSANEAWKRLLEKYPIAETVEQKGVYKIKADQIREFREPRLMAKWDSSDALPGRSAEAEAESPAGQPDLLCDG